MTDCNNVQTHYLEYVVRPQPDMIFFNIYMSRERLKEEKKVSAMSNFKRRKKKYWSA